MSEVNNTVNEQESSQFLTFLLGDESYGLNLLRVKEIIEYAPLTQVPMVPDYIAGVINLRGSVIPVIDVSIRFGGDVAEVSKRSCIVIVEVNCNGETLEMGVQVDEVHEVINIHAGEIEPPPAFGTRIRTDFIAGMGKVKDKFVVLLNIDHVLSLEELTVVESTARKGKTDVEELATV